jgi:hypothetical protein
MQLGLARALACFAELRSSSLPCSPMEVTRQLLTERAGKTGLVRIQLTFCWDSQRLRLGSGQKCLLVGLSEQQ